jgi:hypothetical protein
MADAVVMKARFDGRCTDCGDDICADDTIVHLPDELRTVCEICGGAYLPDDPLDELDPEAEKEE